MRTNFSAFLGDQFIAICEIVGRGIRNNHKLHRKAQIDGKFQPPLDFEIAITFLNKLSRLLFLCPIPFGCDLSIPQRVREVSQRNKQETKMVT